MAKQLDYTTSIVSTLNNGIHGIYFGPHTTFPRLSRSAKIEHLTDQHLRHGLDNFKIESFQLADALPKLLAELDFGLGNDNWIEDDSHIFGTLFVSHILKCNRLLLAHLPFEAHLTFELVHLADSEGGRIYSEMNRGDWSWDTQDQSWQSDDSASHMCIRQDSLDQFFGLSAFLATLSHDW
jgi:hypothetical protein